MDQINVARLMSPGEPLVCGKADMPAPGPKDVRIKVAACNLVPNAYNVLKGLTGMMLPEQPAVVGLDVAGVIDAVGDQVIGLKVGDRVYVDPFLTSETSHQFRRGREDLCPTHVLRGYLGFAPESREMLAQYPMGGLSDYVLSPHNKIAKLPDTIDLLTASRLGYLGTTIGALNKAGFKPGQTLLVNGVTGTLGFGAVAIALGMGASRILGIGRNRELLKRVKALAPNRVDVTALEDHDLVEWVRGQTDGHGVDVMYDCLGLGGDADGTNLAIRAVKDGGNAVLVAGNAVGNVGRPYIEFLMHDVTVMGSQWFTSADLDQLIAMMSSGVVDTSYMQHFEYPLEQVNEAVAFVGTRPGGFANVVVTMSSDR